MAGALWGLFAVLLWSGSFVLTRLGVRTTLNAWDVTALRFGFAALLLLPVIARRGFALDRLGWPTLALLIAGTGAPYGLLIALGLGHAPASQAAALVPGLMAVMAALLGALILGEPLSRQRRWGMAAILTGTLLIGGLSLTMSQSLGHAAFLLAALLWAGYVMVLRRCGLSAWHATAIVAAGSALTYLPVYVAILPVGLMAAPLTDIALQAVYQGGLTTVLGLMAFNRAVALLGAAGGAALPALVPVATLIMGALILGERPSLVEVAAACLIGIGVAIVVFAPSARRANGAS